MSVRDDDDLTATAGDVGGVKEVTSWTSRSRLVIVRKSSAAVGRLSVILAMVVVLVFASFNIQLNSTLTFDVLDLDFLFFGLDLGSS